MKYFEVVVIWKHYPATVLVVLAERGAAATLKAERRVGARNIARIEAFEL